MWTKEFYIGCDQDDANSIDTAAEQLRYAALHTYGISGYWREKTETMEEIECYYVVIGVAHLRDWFKLCKMHKAYREAPKSPWRAL